MVEKTKDITPNEAKIDVLPEHLQASTDKVRTPGWKLFDFLTHWVINWGGNIGASILTAHDTWNYKRNKAIRAGKLKGEEKNLLLGSVSEWFHAFTERAESKWFQPFWDTLMPGRINKNGKDAEKENKDDKYKYTRKQAVGITSGVFILSFGGHLTTLIAQIFETPRIKRRLVRFLDNNVTDPIRKLFGKTPTEEELEERKAVYHKLDNELAGKSAIGMWGSRFAGIGAVILSMISLGAIDKAIVKDNPNLTKDENEELRGFGRAPQAIFGVARKIEEKRKEKDPNYDGIDFLKPAKEGEFVDSAGRNYAQFMARMTALEVVGSTITAVTQYTYLMAREFFGIGPKTNVNMSEKEKQRPVPEITTAKNQQPKTVSKRAESKVDNKEQETKSTRRYAEKTKPAGRSYQDKARHSAVEKTMEQSI